MNQPWISVRLNGLPIEDAYIYRTSLLALTYQGTALLFSVSDIKTAIERAIPDDLHLARAIGWKLFHSEGVGFRYSVAMARARMTEVVSDLSIDLDGSSIPHLEISSCLPANSATDITVYSDVAYVSTDEGLFRTPWPGKESSADTHEMVFSSRLATPCYSATASRGSVVASCGDEGLFLLVDEFGVLPGRFHSQKRVEKYSERASFSPGGLFNFESRSSFSYFRSQLESPTEDESESDGVIVNLEPDTLGVPKDNVKTKSGRHSTNGRDNPSTNVFFEDALDYVFLSRGRLTALQGGWIFSSFVWKSNKTGTLGRKVEKVASPYEGAPISACETSSMFLVETVDGIVSLPSSDHQAPMFRATGPCASLRTFPRSKRYQELAIRTDQEGAVLFAAASNPFS